MLPGDGPAARWRSSASGKPRAREERVEEERDALRVASSPGCSSTSAAPRRTASASARRNAAPRRRRAPAAAQTRSPSTWMSVPPASKRTARMSLHPAELALADRGLERVGDGVDLGVPRDLRRGSAAAARCPSSEGRRVPASAGRPRRAATAPVMPRDLLERDAARDAHVAQRLRHLLERRELRELRPLDRRIDATTSAVRIPSPAGDRGEQDVAGGLAADRRARLVHQARHVAVPDGRA